MTFSQAAGKIRPGGFLFRHQKLSIIQTLLALIISAMASWMCVPASSE
jgi:hypothetical protein